MTDKKPLVSDDDILALSDGFVIASARRLLRLQAERLSDLIITEAERPQHAHSPNLRDGLRVAAYIIRESVE